MVAESSDTQVVGGGNRANVVRQFLLREGALEVALLHAFK